MLFVEIVHIVSIGKQKSTSCSKLFVNERFMMAVKPPTWLSFHLQCRSSTYVAISSFVCVCVCVHLSTFSLFVISNADVPCHHIRTYLYPHKEILCACQLFSYLFVHHHKHFFLDGIPSQGNIFLT